MLLKAPDNYFRSQSKPLFLSFSYIRDHRNDMKFIRNDLGDHPKFFEFEKASGHPLRPSDYYTISYFLKKYCTVKTFGNFLV